MNVDKMKFSKFVTLSLNDLFKLIVNKSTNLSLVVNTSFSDLGNSIHTALGLHQLWSNRTLDMALCPVYSKYISIMRWQVYTWQNM